jgi:preprotein translocase subunit YajC
MGQPSGRPQVAGGARCGAAPAGRHRAVARTSDLLLHALQEPTVFISSAFAQTAAPAGSASSSMLSLLPLVLMFVVLYFIMIRPQMKKQKEHKAMVEALAKGDEVVIAGGVLGKVVKVGDAILGVEVANNTEIQVQRHSVVQVLPKGSYKASL